MDPFEEDRPELTGSLISMEFGPGGRISQLWASDPDLPEEGEEFQFVLPPIGFGEESAEDYYPGTILLGARTGPDQPWIVSRNNNARNQEADDDAPFDAGVARFEYEFPLIEELEVTGKFYEIPSGLYPQIAWDVEIKNTSKRIIEIGEVGFPLAFNNNYDGFGWTDEQLKKLWSSRVYIHKFIAGAASWLFAQRMTAEKPGLLVFPGDNTSWEFFNHVPASLQTPYQWEGIPVVYAHSKATIEREQWPEWVNHHTSVILEPGDGRTFSMRFVPTDSDKREGVHQTLVACGRPSFRLLPSAVAPVGVGIGVEISGIVPKRIQLSRETPMELDSDEEGGFVYVRPEHPGPLRLTVEDDQGRLSHCHLAFTEPIDALIRKRADWIVRNQVVSDPESLQDGAIVLTNAVTGEKITSAEEFGAASGIECSLADALFLAEKNTLFPEVLQIQVLDRYLDLFLLDDLQNPADHSVGSMIVDGSGLGAHYGRPLTYPHVFNLYEAMYRLARAYGETAHPAATYLRHAYETAMAMFRFGWRHYVRTVGLLGYSRIYGLLEELRSEGLREEADRLEEHVRFKARELTKLSFPFAGESVMDTGGFEEVFSAAKYLADDEHLERTVRCAFAARSLAASWWWYGGDKRSWDGADSSPLQALVDRGEACLAHTTIPNSLIFFGLMDRDYLALPEAYMRMAFGGMMGPWALVRPDGAASMCYCPDLASRHAGFNSYTGASGLGYYHYLIGAGAYVLPNRGPSLFTFGCHFDVEGDAYRVVPWDGVGRRIVLRQLAAEFELGFGRFQELRLDPRKRWFEAAIENPSDKPVDARLTVRGLWGSRVSIAGREVDAPGGVAVATIALPPKQVLRVSGRVSGA